MNGVVIGALMALSMAPQTDTTFAVGNANRLDVESQGGTILVTGWDRNEIQVRAEHSSRTYVEIRRRGDGERIAIEAEARRGPATIVDFEISVPRSMNLVLEGMYTDITVEGMTGEVEAETVQGDVVVRGGRGSVVAGSVTGEVLVEGAEGHIEVESAAADIRFVSVSGNVEAESAGGDIIFEDSRATSVDVGTVGGRIRYDGTFAADGTYFFGTHGGSVTLIMPESASASMRLSTIHGTVLSNLNGEMERYEGGQRHRIDVGGGGAVIEAETFGGRISVLRKGTEQAMHPDHGGQDEWALEIEGLEDVAEWFGGVAAELALDITSAVSPMVRIDARSEAHTDSRTDVRSSARSRVHIH